MISTYKQQNSIIKQNVRNTLFNEFDKGRKQLNNYRYVKRNIVTLPNTNFDLESKIKQNYPASRIYCFENNRQVYEEALKVKPCGIDLTNGNIFDNPLDERIDFLYLDLCNSFTEENITKVISYLKQIEFKKGAIFAVTLARQRGKKSSELFKDYYSSYKRKGVVEHLAQFLPPVKHNKVIQYSCKDLNVKSQQMNCIIYKLK